MKVTTQTLIAISTLMLSTNLFAEAHTGNHQTHLNNAAMAAGQGQARPATCRDCFNAGFQRAMTTRVANLGPASSSVTLPAGVRPGTNVAANTQAVARVAVAPTQPRAQRVQATEYIPQNFARPKQRASSVTAPGGAQPGQLVMARQPARPSQLAMARQPAQPQPRAIQIAQRPSQHAAPARIAHGNHYHHNAVQRADCELTDALNNLAGPVMTVVSSSVSSGQAVNHGGGHAQVAHGGGRHHKPQMSPVPVRHGNHSHMNAVERADCELTDALNRMSGPVISSVH